MALTLCKKWVLMAISGLIFGGFFLGIMEYTIMADPKILPGVKVGNTDVSRKSSGEVVALLEPMYQAQLSRKLKLSGAGQVWEYPVAELGLIPDPRETFRRAWQIGRHGGLWHKWQERWSVLHTTTHISPAYQIDDAKLSAMVAKIRDSIYKPPHNAFIYVASGHTLKVIDEVYGRSLDVERSKEKITYALSTETIEEVVLEEIEVPAEITSAIIETWRITGVVGSFITNFDANNANRSHNIKTAAERIKNLLVMPGEVFSFNEIVGPRTAGNGYKEAIIIENNKFVPGIGGGVCQVSTTLYNAALRANMTIVERHPHSLAIQYVPLGMDATVSYHGADLKFRNDFNKPVLFHADYTPGVLQMTVFGAKDEFPKIQISGKIIKVLEPLTEKVVDSSVPPGQTIVEEKGKRGFKVEVRRNILVDGEIVSSEIISRDTYRAQKTIIRVSPGQ